MLLHRDSSAEGRLIPYRGWDSKVFWTELDEIYFHEIDCVASQGNEHDLHDEYIEGFPSEEEVDISGEKDNEEKLLGSIG